MTPTWTHAPSWLPALRRLRGRGALAFAALACACAMRFVIGPCDDWDWVLFVVLPLLGVQVVAALLSLVRLGFALARRDARSALLELVMVPLMLAVVPAAIAANVVLAGKCVEE